jgi:hypothetical protein
MKILSIWVVLIVQALSSAGQAAETRVPQARQTPASPQAPRAWLGIRVAKPDEGITAQVPSLPPGIGFVVKSMDEGGPAQAAGLMELDLLWKIGDQMLVNEAQLATLLRLYEPGQEVVISGFRGGKPIELKLKLGVAPELTKPFSGEMVESAILPGACGGPMRIVNVAEKSASFSADGCQASVRREGEVFKVRIDGPKSELIYEGELTKERNLEEIPGPWRRKIEILCRTLDQALSGEMLPERQPRPRVVPPPVVKP